MAQAWWGRGARARHERHPVAEPDERSDEAHDLAGGDAGRRGTTSATSSPASPTMSASPRCLQS
jgi:hypothetical protein